MKITTLAKMVPIAPESEKELDKYLADVRESLVTGNRQYLRFMTLIIASIVTYNLVVFNDVNAISWSWVKLTNMTLFRRVFLIVPAALIAAMACVAFITSLQRDVYDQLTLARYPIMQVTGLHEFRLPTDYNLGMNMMVKHGGRLGKSITMCLALLMIFTFFVVPIAYIVWQSIGNMSLFGPSDVLCDVTSLVSIMLCTLGVLILYLNMRLYTGIGASPSSELRG